MKIIIAPDSFKGSISAADVAKTIAKTIQAIDPQIETIAIPIADGGEGTVENLVQATNGYFIETIVSGPLLEKTQAIYGVLGDGVTCVIEVAAASGLPLLTQEAYNPLIATSYGTGELIKDALDKGYRSFIIGLGGSATNDAGVGILQALGASFWKANGQPIEQGGIGLGELATMNLTKLDPRIQESTWHIASDVTNPLIGENGASYVFGPQKGASHKDVMALDQALTHFANCIEQTLGHSIHERQGAGAAGGIGGMLQAFFPVTFERGIDVVMNASNLREQMINADLVITGEGKSDRQTLSGKVPIGIAEVAAQYAVPVILLSGLVEEQAKRLLQPYFTEIHSIVGGHITTAQSINAPADYIQQKVHQVMTRWLAENH